jgi:hypothetical protein
MMDSNNVETWEITLPDGTRIADEIEYRYAMDVTGIVLSPYLNRRVITHPDETIDVVPVPENFKQNRADLEQLCKEWKEAEQVFSKRIEVRENLYPLYKLWLEEHLKGNTLSSILFASAAKKET